MSRYIHLIGLWILALAMVGCQEEEDSALTDGTGLLISLTNDVEVTTKSTPKELGEPLKQKFKLKVVNDATPSLKYYEGNYKEGLKVSTPEGRFRLTAEYGTNPILALNDPYYKGDTIAEVEKGKTTSVSISCKVANALTSVVFGEPTEGQDFTADFSDYRVDVFVEEDENHTYVAPVEIKDNGKSAYYRAGTIPTFTFVGTVNGTGKPYTFKLENDKLKDVANFAAGKHCKITLTMAKAEAGLKVEVSKVEVEKVDINKTIPLDWLPKPKLEASKAFENNTLSIVETQTVSDALVKLNTATGLQDLKMKFYFTDEQFASLNDKEYLLSNAEDKAAIEALGIQLPTIGEKGQVIDFTSVVNKLLTNNGETTENTVELDVKSNNRWSSEDTKANRVYTLRCENPGIMVSVDERNCWSREFTIDEITLPDGSKADIKKIKANLVYQYYDGSEWKECASRENKKGRLQQFAAKAEEIATKEYKVRALYRGAVASVSDVTATLEEPTQLPNSDMEEWTESGVARSIITYNPWNSTSSSFWQTNNSYTTRYVSNSGFLKAGSNPYNCFPAVSYVVGGHRGNRAAEIRSTASGRGNTLPSNVLPLNKVAGELFTGNVTVSQGGTAATPKGDKYTVDTNGRSFSSRPTSLVFWYKYLPINNDTWKAEIILMDADHNTLASEKLTKSEKINDWTTVQLDLNYAENKVYAKCCYIYIVFSSTITTGEAMQYKEYDSYNLWVNNSLKKFDDTKCWIGSILTIDDISLIYDK